MVRTRLVHTISTLTSVAGVDHQPIGGARSTQAVPSLTRVKAVGDATAHRRYATRRGAARRDGIRHNTAQGGERARRLAAKRAARYR